MSAPQNSTPENITPLVRIAQKPGVRQLAKFGLVGISSTIVNFAVLNLMLIVLHQNKYAAVTVAFLVSVINGYFWNRRWTFKNAPTKAVHTQFTQFLLVNLVSWGLDLLFVRLISVPLENDFHISMVKATNLAQLVATGVLVFWNYFANRLWTFKH
jgi:putative flippase GtrA